MVKIHLAGGFGGPSPEKEIIPTRSFGHCRWCGTEGKRLSFLMCPDCARIAEMIPSKTNVLLNRPEVKRRLGGGATVGIVVPELRNFLMDAKARFPPERSYAEHWDTMIEQAVSLVGDGDVRKRIAEMIDDDSIDTDSIPPTSEIEKQVGVDNVIRFILHVAVLRGILKLDSDGGGSCMICGRESDEDGHLICVPCRNDIGSDVSDAGPALEEPKPYAGMHTSDITQKRR